jgi:hypothetical protein
VGAALLGSGAGSSGHRIWVWEIRIQQEFESMEGHICGSIVCITT